MEVDELPSIDPNVDYREIFPIHQKRTIAFINHFVMNTVSFLNEFSKSCESRLMEFEYKIQKVEASLLILESQLASIAGLNIDEKQNISSEKHEETLESTNLDLPQIDKDTSNNNVEHETSTSYAKGPVASEDTRFKKFFKMVQFGVPPQAVKLKMETEGLDSSILDKPNEVIPGYETVINKYETNNSSDSDIS